MKRLWPLFAVNALYMFVSGSLYPLLPLYLREVGVGVIERGVILTGAAATSALSALLWGYLSDRTGKRRAYVLLGGAGQSLAFLLLSTPQSLGSQVLLYLLSLSLGSAIFTLVMASAGGEGEVSEAMGSFWAGGSLGWALGTAVSGQLYERLGILAVFLASSALAALCTVLAAGCARDSTSPVAGDGIRTKLFFHPKLFVLLALVFAFICVDVLKNLYIPTHYAYQLGLGVSTAMLSLSLTSWLEVPSILAFGRVAKRVSRWILFSLSLALAAAYLILNCFASSLLHAFALMGFYSLVWGSFSVSSSVLVAELSRALGTAYGAYNMVSSLANIAAPIIASLLMERSGYNALLTLFAALSALSSVAALICGSAPNHTSAHAELHPDAGALYPAPSSSARAGAAKLKRVASGVGRAVSPHRAQR